MPPDGFSSLPDDVKRYSYDLAGYSRDIAESVADSIDRHMDAVYHSIRLTLQTSPWIPESIKPPHRPLRSPPSVPLGYLARAQDWVNKNRAITAAIIAFFGTGTFLILRRRRIYRQKRRARKGPNGTKTEVVILAGSPHSPLTRTLAHDLDRRGFIVYIPVSTLEEEQVIRDEARSDIRPINIDITSPDATSAAIAKFSAQLSSPSFPRSAHLASLILVPSYPSTHPVLPIASFSPALWSDTLNSHVLSPLALTHAFLPLLLAQLSAPAPNPAGQNCSTYASSPMPTAPTTIVVLKPCITSSLPLPSHSAEAVTVAALTAYLRTLRVEMPPSLQISTLHLGAFNFGHTSESKRQLVLRSWGGSPGSDTSTGSKTAGKDEGSPLRVLHNAVFDAVAGHATGTIFVGRGARAYSFAGKWLPVGLVRWMVLRTGSKTGGESEAGTPAGNEEWENVEDETEEGTAAG